MSTGGLDLGPQWAHHGATKTGHITMTTMPRMNVYAFDVDETLVLGDPPGPITIEQLMWLKAQGNIVGICGNYGAIFRKLHGWQNLFSFWNYGWSKGEVLIGIRQSFFLAGVSSTIDAFILVGNEGMGDKQAAIDAGWTFVEEKNFKEGL